MPSKSIKIDQPAFLRPRLPKPPRPVVNIKREVLPNDVKARLNVPLKVANKIAAPVRHVKESIQQILPHKITYKAMIPVVAVFLLIMLGIQSFAYLLTAKEASGVVLGAATSAYDDLDSANKSLGERNFNEAKSKFASAQGNLVNAQNELDKFRMLALIAPPARSADSILTGAYLLADAGKNLTTAMQLFDELSVNSGGISTANFTEKLRQNKELLQSSLTLLAYAEEKFASAGDLPGDYSSALDQARAQIATLKGVLSDLVDLEDLFLSFFGTAPKTYLLIFQNHDEMRATGGFIGTYGRLKYDNGAIRDLKIESVYNIDGSLNKKIAAPGPLQPDIKKWAMRDANWFVDFPTSAQKLLQFFEMESETADGLIALTPQIFVDLLKLVGPVEMPEYDVTLTPENFQDVVQAKTSVEYDRKLNQPKKFLHDFAPLLLNKLTNLDKEQWFSLFQMFKDNFSQKQMMVYSADRNTQDKISNLGFDGKILSTDTDYLAVVNTNLGGTKTDLEINQKIHYRSEVNSDGQIVNTVEVTRENAAIQSNKNFMRILVPLGSRLLETAGFQDLPQFSSSAEGYEIDPDLAAWDQKEQFGNASVRTEAGKTEFTGWVVTPGNGASKVIVKYILPFKVNLTFFDRSMPLSLLFQKQPGVVSTEVSGEWALSGFNADWNSKNTSKEGKNVKFASDGKTDEYWSMVLTK